MLSASNIVPTVYMYIHRLTNCNYMYTVHTNVLYLKYQLYNSFIGNKFYVTRHVYRSMQFFFIYNKGQMLFPLNILLSWNF